MKCRWRIVGRIVGLTAILGLSLWLRLGGLAHDLDVGIVYHPDTPKQAHVTQRFIRGQYLFHIGDHDYDGYPYFNSRMAEALFRTVIPSANAVLHHLGLCVDVTSDSTTVLWVLRLMNVGFSLGLVILTYILGRILFGVGWLAALFAALSPLSVISCHYAMSDTSAAFFAFVTVLFCVRIYRHGHAADYGAAAVSAAFAFSAKYHGGIVLFSCVAAHFLRWGSLKAAFGKGARLRIGVACAMAIAGFVVATPGALVDPERVIKDIVDFLGYTSSFGSEEMLSQMHIGQRVLFALQHNAGDFLSALSPIGVLLLLGGIVLLRRCRREVWIIATLPILYVFVGLPFKPMTHPAYHELATPSLFVLLAGMLISGFRTLRWRKCLAPLCGCVAVAIVFELFSVVSEQVFFFKMPDTRRLATQWHDENVPPLFAVEAQRYTLLSGSRKGWDASGIALYRLGDPQCGKDSALSAQFDVGDSQFTLFRNPPIAVTIPEGAMIRRGWQLPVFSFMPSVPAHDIVLSDTPSFVRSPLVRIVEPGKPQRLHLMQSRPLSTVWAVIRCGRLPSQVTVAIGGDRRTLLLSPFESALVSFKDLEPDRISAGGHFAYRAELRSSLEQVRVQFCTTAETYGAALFNAGFFEAAAQVFTNTDLTNPSLSLMAAACSTGTVFKTKGVMPCNFMATNLLSQFGVSEAYIESLPGVDFLADDFIYETTPLAVGGSFSLPAMMLDSGVYTIELQMHPASSLRSSDSIVSVINDRTREQLTLCEMANDDESRVKGRFRFFFELPADVAACRVVLGEKVCPDDVLSVSCRVNVLKSLEMLTRPHSIPAKSSIPDTLRTCDVAFSHGISLRGWQLGPELPLPVGRSSVLHLYWNVEELTCFLHEVGVWVHFVDSEDNIIFQADRSLSVDLSLRPDDGWIEGLGAEFTIPDHVLPGDYKLVVGLYVPMQSRPLKIQASSLPLHGKGVALESVRTSHVTK